MSSRLPVDDLTIGEVLRRTARRIPDQDAYVFCQPGDRATWAELDRQVDEAARGLMALGFQRGDRFGVWATNWPRWVILQFATARIGVVLVTINPAYRANELRYALQQSEIRGLALIEKFRSTQFFSLLSGACPEVAQAASGRIHSEQFPHLEHVIALSEPPAPGMIPWEAFLARADETSTAHLAEREAQLSPKDPINIQYTSGTTGRPKGATLSHRNILINAWHAGVNQAFTSADRLCIPVPLYHCFGCVLGTLCSVVHGTAMIFPAEGFDPAATLRGIEAERCTAIYGVPTMFIAMVEHADYPQRDLSSLRTGIMAGSPCPIELMRRVTSEMGASEITIGYGQTEASPLITQTRTDDAIELRVGTVGRPLPGLEVKVIDPATGAALPDRQPGELCARGHCVMQGYYNMPDKTAEAIDGDGWLHTGDLALREPNGYYRITGRIKDLIIRGGENIYPREIEERLYEHPAIEDVQVVGVPDRKYGEEVLACIRLRQGCTLTDEEVRQFCRAELAHFKAPKYVKFVEAFPTTVTGKVQKFVIREQAIRELGLEEAASVETA
jgi:fatty-acyl-CoA synthase